MAVSEVLALTLGAQDTQTLTALVNHNVRAARRARMTMDDRTAGYWARYEADEPKREKAYGQEPNLRAQLTMWVVDGVLVRLMRTIAGQLPYLRVNDESLETPPDSLPIQDLLQHLAETDLALRFRWGQLFLNALVEGTAIGKLRREESSRTVRDRRTGFDRLLRGDALVERTVTDKVGLAYDVLDLKDFWLAHPGIVDLDQQPWVAHRFWLTWDDVVRRQRDGRFRITQSQLDLIKPKGIYRRASGDASLLDSAKADLDRAESTDWTNVLEWPFYEVEGRFDPQAPASPEQTQECLITTLVDFNEFPMRADKYPFWNGHRNYILYRPIPRANRAYGRSLAGIMQPLQDEADARLNLDLSAGVLSVLLRLTPILPRSMQRAWETHKWSPLKPVYVDAPEQFKMLSAVVGELRALDPQLEKLFQIAERVSGMSDPQLGKATEGSKTAFEISTVQSEGNIKFAEYIEQLQTGNTELGFQIIEHAYQLQMESDTFRQRILKVCGLDPFAGVSLADIRQRWTVVPVGNTMIANRELEARKWMGLFQLFKDDIFVQINPEHSWFLRNKLLQAIGVDREIPKIIGDEKDVKAFADAQLAQRAQAGDLSAQVMQQSRQGSRFGRTRALGTEAVPGVIEPPGAFVPPPQ